MKIRYSRDFLILGRLKISRAIRELREEWIREGIVDSIHQIGMGQCYDFADELEERLVDVPGIERRETEEWWKEPFLADVEKLKASGEPLPRNLTDNEIELLLGAATHAWISWNGIHYDATAPEGKRHFLALPFFANQLTKPMSLVGSTIPSLRP